MNSTWISPRSSNDGQLPRRSVADPATRLHRDGARYDHRRAWRHRPAQQPYGDLAHCGIYVEAIRNTPLLVQIFLVYFGLASLGLKFSAFTVAAAALTINVGAYTTEIMRAGFDSIPRGQIEAAEGLALSRVQIYWHVVLLPAIERVYPALTSQFVLLMLASSVTSQISAEELTAVANYVQSDTYRAFETYILVAIVYVFLSLLMRAGFWLSASCFSRAVGASAPLCEETMGGSLK